MDIIGNDWDELLADEWGKPYFGNLFEFIDREYGKAAVFPPENRIFAALELTSYANTRVVIVGQDPYHGAGQANGLAFSVAEDVNPPPSLVNIFKEIDSEYGTFLAGQGLGDLTAWARQGVLLLNTVLTVRKDLPGSHRGKGWEKFTDAVLRVLNANIEPVVFMLWGKDACDKRNIVNNPWHLALTAPHPSPLSAYKGFFGCGHFKAANEFLELRGMDGIDWRML